eukprot:4995689-Pleurochrysis_carterae.AAC.1
MADLHYLAVLYTMHVDEGFLLEYLPMRTSTEALVGQHAGHSLCTSLLLLFSATECFMIKSLSRHPACAGAAAAAAAAAAADMKGSLLSSNVFQNVFESVAGLTCVHAAALACALATFPQLMRSKDKSGRRVCSCAGSAAAPQAPDPPRIHSVRRAARCQGMHRARARRAQLSVPALGGEAGCVGPRCGKLG